MICNACKKNVTKRFDGQVMSNGRRVYHDENGLRWNGAVCPPCKINSQKEKQDPRGKLCKCGRVMPKTRYYRCEECKPVLRDDPGEFIYS
jgi:hypothetical protein